MRMQAPGERRWGGAQVALAIMLAGTLAACGKKEVAPIPPPPVAAADDKPEGAPPAEAQPGLSANQRLARAVDLLQAGDERGAGAELAIVLRDDPNRREAQVLRQSIEGDARAMLPADSFAYVVQPGDTFITLAIEFLGDSYKFHALAKMNGRAGERLKAGDTIQIPGRYRAPRREREDRQRAPTSRPRPATPEATTPVTPPTATPQADPRRAQQLRRAGLEALSGGRIASAVSRLEQAARLDPGNGAIAADLARARRIQTTVQGRN